MVAVRSRDELLSYDEAARLLGIQRDSVKQLVSRGHLHSVPAPEDRRRRRVLRSEVSVYAREHAGKWSYTSSAREALDQSEQSGHSEAPLALMEAGVAGAAAIGLITALRRGSDATAQLLIIGALVALAFLLFLEWRRQGKLDAAQQKRLEKLAKRAEAGESSDEFLAEFEELLLSA